MTVRRTVNGSAATGSALMDSSGRGVGRAGGPGAGGAYAAGPPLALAYGAGLLVYGALGGAAYLVALGAPWLLTGLSCG